MENVTRTVFQEIMINVLIPLLSAVAIYVANKVRLWLDARTQEIENDQMRKALEFALERLDATVATVVAEIGQTMVQRDKNNKVVDQQKLLETALTRVKDRLAPGVMKTLDKNFGNKVFEIVTGKIESKVKPCAPCSPCSP